MSKKIRVFLIPALLVVFTIATAFVAFLSYDYFYLIIALIVDAIISLLFFPKILSSRHISLPSVNKPDLSSVNHPQKRVIKKPDISLGKIKINLKSKLFLAHIVYLSAFSLFFAYLLIFKLPAVEMKSNLLADYLGALIKENNKYSWVYLLLPTSLLAFSFFFIKKAKKVKRLLKAVVSTTLNIVLASIFAILLTLLFSFVDITNLKRQLTDNPQSVGVYTEKDKIVEELKKFDNPPKIIGKDKDLTDIVVSLVIKDKSEFYNEKIIPLGIKLSPSKLDLSSNSILLVNDNLIITEIDKEKVEAVSPIIGKLFVKKVLAPRYIKDEPDVNIMGRQEYLKYRDDQINEAVAEIDDIITELEKGINTLYGNISNDKNMIASNENGVSDSISYRDSYYQNCITAGYYSYYYGTFYRYYSDSYCDSQKAEWDSIVAQYQNNVQDWKNQLAYDQKQLAEFQEYKTLVEDYRELVASQKDKTPNELGIFEPEKSVKVVLENTDTSSLADFYATLVHEYLHYTSYVSEERQLDGFFEEGLTEYFARKTIKENLDIDTNLGYPLISNLILEMTKKVPVDRLEEIYFTKDHNSLVTLLNETYGKNFYEDSQLYFTIIYYVPSKDALKVANNIMFKIGGNELQEEDIVSTYSDFD